MVSELNYMCQIVVMLYEDPTKDPTSEERFFKFKKLLYCFNIYLNTK